MWPSPLKLMQAFVEDVCRDMLVNDLNRLSDHLLNDIGLRRDQLDLLRLKPTQAELPAGQPALRSVAQPSLQGCG